MPSWDEDGDCTECGYEEGRCRCKHDFDFPFVYFEFKQKKKKKCILCKKNEREEGEDYEWKICSYCLDKTGYDEKYLVNYKVIA